MAKTMTKDEVEAMIAQARADAARLRKLAEKAQAELDKNQRA
jgi:hypothetical protein